MTNVQQLFSTLAMADTALMATQISAGQADIIVVDMRYNGYNNISDNRNVSIC